MTIRSIGAILLLACSAASTAWGQGPGHQPPPPPHQGGPGGQLPPPDLTGTAPDLSGSGPALSGSNCPPPSLGGSDAQLPPPDLSGSDPALSGSNCPQPPDLSGSGPDLSGSGAFAGQGGLGGPGGDDHQGPGGPGNDRQGPPDLSGSGDPIASGSGGAPGCFGGTFGLPTGTSEILTEKVTFTATSGSTTSATALFQAIGISGTDSGSLDVRTKGLTSGTYTVTAVTTSGTSPVTLGTFDVNGPVVTGSGLPPVSHAKTRTRFGGPRGIAFPDGFDPFDITSLAISDADADVLFTADLTTLTNASFDARTPAVTGTSVSGATGYVQVHASANNGTVTGFLSILGKGLPDSTTYTYAINGTDIGTVTTGSSGTLKLQATEGTNGTLPGSVNLFSVTSVTVHDSDGNLILSASF